MDAGTRSIIAADHRHRVDARSILAEQRCRLESILGIDIVDLQPQTAGEYADPVGHYRWPHGRLLLARSGGRTIGCVAVRRVDDTTAELKRMYVRPTGRCLSAGAQLVRAAIAVAEDLEVDRLVLETVLPDMATAVALYRAAGFVERTDAPARFTPGLVHLERPIAPRLEAT